MGPLTTTSRIYVDTLQSSLVKPTYNAEAYGLGLWLKTEHSDQAFGSGLLGYREGPRRFKLVISDLN